MPPEFEQLQNKVTELEQKLANLERSDRYTFQKDIQMLDGRKIQFAKGTGTKIGTATDQKLGLWGTTPIIQPTTAVSEAAFVENAGGTAVNVDSTFGGYTIQQVVQALQNKGDLA